MAERITDQVDSLMSEVAQLREALVAAPPEWRAAERCAKAALSTLSKLTTRLRGLVDAVEQMEGQGPLF